MLTMKVPEAITLFKQLELETLAAIVNSVIEIKAVYDTTYNMKTIRRNRELFYNSLACYDWYH